MTTIPHAMNLCNACEWRPMAAGQQAPDQPGYCETCFSGWMNVSDLDQDQQARYEEATESGASPDEALQWALKA